MSETLLITLAARATAADLNPDLRFHDPLAQRIVRAIGFDPARFSRDRATMRGVLLRAGILDDIARGFLKRNPGGRVVALGTGLDTRFHRVDDGTVEWLEVDLPPVIDALGRLLEPHPRRRLHAGSLTDDGWLEAVPKDRPVLVIVEGVLMYLPAADVRSLFVRTARALPTGSELAFDFIHPVMAMTSRVHPSVRKTDGRFRWGLRRMSTLTRWAPEWRLVDRIDYMRRVPRVQRAAFGVFRAVAGRSLVAVGHLRHR